MKLRIIARICVLASATAVFAGPPATTTFSGASLLKGTYTVASHRARYVSWSAQVSCKNYSGPLYAGSDVANEANEGTVVFDGKGGASMSGTQYGSFDEALSELTPTWGCDSNGSPYITNSGHAVYDPPQPFTETGNYSVQSDYTGQINFPDVQLSLRLAGVNWIGLATSFTFHILKDNTMGEVGLGIMQLCGRWCVP